MFKTLADVKGLGTVSVDDVYTDNKVFRLHYKATVAIFIASCSLIMAKTYLGDPIDCIVEEIPSAVRLL